MNARLAYVSRVYSIVDEHNGKDRWGEKIVNYTYPPIGRKYTKISVTWDGKEAGKDIFIESPDCKVNLFDEYRISFENNKRVELHLPKSNYDEEDLKLLAKLICKKENLDDADPYRVKTFPY